MPEGNVNSQITDSVTQSIAAILGNSPAETKSMLDTLMAETVGMAMYNAVTNQHNAQMVGNASMTAACARMLKTATPAPAAVRPVLPIVATISPTPVPLPPAAAQVQVTGTGFDPALAVVITLGGTKFAHLSGSSQLSGVTASSFSFSNAVFTVEGVYGLQIQNPDGGTSAIMPLNVLALPPSVTAVTATAASLSVTGSNFLPGLSVAIVNQSGVPVVNPVASGVTATTLTVTCNPVLASGPYGITVTNPDGRSSPTWLFNV